MRVRPPEPVPLLAAVHPRTAGPPRPLPPQVGWPLSFRAFFEFRKIGTLSIFAVNEMFYKIAQNLLGVELKKKF